MEREVPRKSKKFERWVKVKVWTATEKSALRKAWMKDVSELGLYLEPAQYDATTDLYTKEYGQTYITQEVLDALTAASSMPYKLTPTMSKVLPALEALETELVKVQKLAKHLEQKALVQKKLKADVTVSTRPQRVSDLVSALVALEEHKELFFQVKLDARARQYPTAVVSHMDPEFLLLQMESPELAEEKLLKADLAWMKGDVVAKSKAKALKVLEGDITAAKFFFTRKEMKTEEGTVVRLELSLTALVAALVLAAHG